MPGSSSAFRSVPSVFLVVLLAAGFLEASMPVFGQQQPQPPQEVTEIDLEDLMKVQVTSAAKKQQTLVEVPAAISVIRTEDLRRTGVTNLPEALRRIPGFQVTRSDANSWNVGARGFNSGHNKLLVLIDGRSVYSPLHSGVFWEMQDVLLEDVERIEVIRGPGGTLWGANAINGVVNVITKSAKDTLGGYVTGGAGFEERNFAGARYGSKVGEDHAVRVYGKYFDRDDSLQSLNPDERSFDDLFMARGGFRSDWKAGEKSRITFQGDYFEGEAQQRTNEPLFNPPFSRSYKERKIIRGGNVLWRWNQEFDAGSSLTLQLYYDHTLQESETFRDALDTGDLDFQHRFTPLPGHDVIWGAGYRVYRSDLDGSFFITTSPEERTDDLVSVFVQDEIALSGDRLRLTIGSKFEHNDYSGFDYQPSVRLGWRPDDDNMIWLAASRAVRTPSIIDHDLRINFVLAPPDVNAFIGSRDFKSEELIALEAGYRTRPFDALQLDLALFYNEYDNLRSTEPGAPFSEDEPPPTHTVNPTFLENNMTAVTYGAEMAVNVQAASWWLIQGRFTYLYMNLRPDDDSADTMTEVEERRNPRSQAWVRSAMDLPANLTLDVMGRYVSRLPTGKVDSYVEADVRLSWRSPEHGIEIALVGQNLLHEEHLEVTRSSTAGRIERGGYLSVTWRF